MIMLTSKQFVAQNEGNIPQIRFFILAPSSF